ncbi:MAG TPA: hypothetical protein VL002_09795 [Candidimonas sp.]|nr:hypothetical protein [Candidimonas sp.]
MGFGCGDVYRHRSQYVMSRILAGLGHSGAIVGLVTLAIVTALVNSCVVAIARTNSHE